MRLQDKIALVVFSLIILAIGFTFGVEWQKLSQFKIRQEQIKRSNDALNAFFGIDKTNTKVFFNRGGYPNFDLMQTFADSKALFASQVNNQQEDRKNDP